MGSHKMFSNHDYNQNMGGVGKSDQLIEKYNVRMKYLKWWKTLFFHFIDIAVVNSYIIFQEWRAQNPKNESVPRIARYAQLDFREELACHLGSIDKNTDVPLYAPHINLDRPATLHPSKLTIFLNLQNREETVTCATK